MAKLTETPTRRVQDASPLITHRAARSVPHLEAARG
jgi:hypothetical protein